jgi:hypothetical protein
MVWTELLAILYTFAQGHSASLELDLIYVKQDQMCPNEFSDAGRSENEPTNPLQSVNISLISEKRTTNATINTITVRED